MRISELIEELINTVEAYGDLKCVAGYRDPVAGSSRFDEDIYLYVAKENPDVTDSAEVFVL